MRRAFYDQVFYRSATHMHEVDDDTVQLIITSPPYFNIKDYAKNGYQNQAHSRKMAEDLGGMDDYAEYLTELARVWRECARVLKPNGKLCINVPLMPMPKRQYQTHYNRHIFDLQSGIQNSVLGNTELFLLDLYVWNRTNSSKNLMFGSYPYPHNFYAQNTAEFITVYVKDGAPQNAHSARQKEASRLTQREWVEWTKQIWDIPAPGKDDAGYGVHPALMPEEIAYRCIRLYSFVGDLVLDPFAGSGTSLKVAKENDRHYVGYELYQSYKTLIEKKLSLATGQLRYGESA